MLADAEIELRTKRLVLRPMRPSDAEPLFALFADWEVIRWLSMPPWPYMIADAHEFLGSLERSLTKTTFAITRDEALIGGIDVRMNQASRSQSGDGPNLGYWLGRAYWGRCFRHVAARIPRARVCRRDRRHGLQWRICGQRSLAARSGKARLCARRRDHVVCKTAR